MNLQIWSKGKCFDSKKAQRYFKERRLKFQEIDIEAFGMSRRELESVLSSVKDIDLLFDKNSPLFEEKMVAHLKRTKEEKMQLLLEYPSLFATPVVRNGKQSTVGYQPGIWKKWENE